MSPPADEGTPAADPRLPRPSAGTAPSPAAPAAALDTGTTPDVVVALVAAAVAGGASAYVTAPPGTRALAYVVVAGAALLATVQALRQRPLEARAGWSAVVAGFGCFFLGDLRWVVEGTDAALGSAGSSVLYAAGYTAMALGVGMFVRDATPDRSWSVAIQAAIVGLVVATAGWGLLTPRGGGGPGPARLAWAVGDVALLAMLAGLAVGAAADRLPAQRRLFVSLFLLLAGDVALVAGVALEGRAGGAVDLLWLGSYVAAALAIRHPSAEHFPRPSTAPTAIGVEVAVLGAAVVVAPMVGVIRHVPGHDRPILLGLGALLAVLVGSRVLLLRREQAAAQRTAARGARRLEALVAHAGDGVAVVAPDGTLLFANPAVARLLGRREARPDGRLRLHDLAGVDRRDVDDALAQALAREGSWGPVDWRVPGADGRTRTLEIVGTNLVDDPAVGGIVVNAHDVTDREEAQATLRHQATHDGLTGLPNRVAFLEQLERRLSGTRRGDGVAAVLYVDLDHFKAVNDTLGHAAGDRLLVEVAARMRATVRPDDVVARLGGDEFVVLCDRVADLDDARAAAERLRAALGRPVDLGTGSLTSTASIGVALGRPTDRPDELLRRADIGLYQAKAGGRDRTAVVDDRGARR